MSDEIVSELHGRAIEIIQAKEQRKKENKKLKIN